MAGIIARAVMKHGDNWKWNVPEAYRYTEVRSDFSDYLAIRNTPDPKRLVKYEATTGKRYPTFALSYRKLPENGSN